MRTADDSRWMALAYEQARRGLGRTSPNPPVGCVIVKHGRVIATGFHRRAGEPHAEIEALRVAGARARGADMYVTLEPCCHYGRTGPCTRAVAEAGIARVVAACRDPNPTVAGKGLRALARAGVRTTVGVLEEQCDDLIRGFRLWVQRQVPWVELKMAVSLDGRIAACGGRSKWLSSRASRALVQEMRARSDAILVGVETVLHDDPRLTVRGAGAADRGAQPLRVVLDRRLRTPVAARVVSGPGRCLIVCAKGAPTARARRLEAAGAEVVALAPEGARGWKRLLRFLAARSVLEVLVEGGSQVATSALGAGVVNGLTIFYTPKLIGSDGVPLVGPLGVRDPARALRVRLAELKTSDGDVVWRGVFD
jgi:diaminohydroxyphosphoribosylaminopyrimidine deaminase/5-amino-6-(5-phosphoribosylamino)uracil reductase